MSSSDIHLASMLFPSGRLAPSAMISSFFGVQMNVRLSKRATSHGSVRADQLQSENDQKPSNELAQEKTYQVTFFTKITSLSFGFNIKISRKTQSKKKRLKKYLSKVKLWAVEVCFLTRL